MRECLVPVGATGPGDAFAGPRWRTAGRRGGARVPEVREAAEHGRVATPVGVGPLKAVTAYNGYGLYRWMPITVTPDHADPTATITAPTASQTVSGTQTVSVSASDGGAGVESVTLRVCVASSACGGAQGTVVGTDASAPYDFSWDTTGLADGSYKLVARADDNVDNHADSAAVVVTVDNGSSLMGSSARRDETGGGVVDSGDAAASGSASGGEQASAGPGAGPAKGDKGGHARCGQGRTQGGSGKAFAKQHGGKAKHPARRDAHGKGPGPKAKGCKPKR